MQIDSAERKLFQNVDKYEYKLNHTHRDKLK